jgi:hypothetical protein
MWLCRFDDSTTVQRLLVTLAARCLRPSICRNSWIDVARRVSCDRPLNDCQRHRLVDSTGNFDRILPQQLMTPLPTRSCRWGCRTAVQSSRDPGHQSSTSVDLNQLNRSERNSVGNFRTRPSIRCKRQRHLLDSTGTVVHTTHQIFFPQHLISCSQRQKCHTILRG